MRKRFASLLLIVAMMVACMPSFAFADDTTSTGFPEGKTYVAFGDSIATGFAINWENWNINIGEEPYDVPWNRFEDVTGEEKGASEWFGNGFVHPSYVTELKSLLNASDNSYNASYPGYRAQEVCYYLGAMNKTERDAYYGSDVYNFVNSGFADLMGGDFAVLDPNNLEFFSRERAKINNKIKSADVITVQYGLNDFTMMTVGREEKLNELIDAISTIGTSEVYAKAIEKLKSSEAGLFEKTLNTFALLSAMSADGLKVTNLLAELNDMINDAITNAITYNDKLVKHIHDTNPNAIVVIVGVYNPLATIGDTIEPLIKSEVGAKAINDVAAAIVQPSLNKINKAYKETAAEYNYEFADSSNLAPNKDKLFHMDATANKRMAKIIKAAIDREWTLRNNAQEGETTGSQSPSTRADRCQCGSNEYTTEYVVAPTYFANGKAQDYCYGCHNKLGKEYVVTKLQLGKVKSISVKAGSKKATVKYAAVKDATGYQVYYKQSGKSAKKVTTTALSKTIKSLKKGKKYTFKVRAYVTENDKTCYGAWSKTVSKKIK